MEFTVVRRIKLHGSVPNLCPPTAQADAVATMIRKVNADILEAYPTAADIFIIHRMDDLAHVMVNGTMGSENPKYRQIGAPLNSHEPFERRPVPCVRPGSRDHDMTLEL
jgi:hypothetical protein